MLPNDTAISLQLQDWNRSRGVCVYKQSSAYYVTAFAGVLVFMYKQTWNIRLVIAFQDGRSKQSNDLQSNKALIFLIVNMNVNLVILNVCNSDSVMTWLRGRWSWVRVRAGDRIFFYSSKHPERMWDPLSKCGAHSANVRPAQRKWGPLNLLSNRLWEILPQG
jgi:hypothetical protein